MADTDVGRTNERMNPEMTAEALVGLLRLLGGAGVEVWLDGGWAVDAVLGKQTRPHKDVDIILRAADITRLREILEGQSFKVLDGGTESNFVLADRTGLEVDVHAIVFDQDGNGVYRMANGSDWIFPASGFSGQGIVQGIQVRCLSPETQVLCHAHGMSRRRRTCEIWNCSRPASALSYRRTSGAIRSDAAVRELATDPSVVMR